MVVSEHLELLSSRPERSGVEDLLFSEKKAHQVIYLTGCYQL